MRDPLNETACAAKRENVSWSDPSLLAQLGILAVIDVLVIVGNCLVIAAVFCSSKLRSVTNLFIVSLAVADLMVGVAVLPFSATWEIFKVWIFGDVWCSVWLAVDVWMCTASILNLCAISLDRYVAVTRPVTYPSIMSSKRAKMLIAGLWVLSFVICFPPLVGWKDDKTLSDTCDSRVLCCLTSYNDDSDEVLMEENDEEGTSNNNNINSSTVPSIVENPPCPWTCELTNEAGYVVYSALGSFYIPMFVMLFFYWRIYKAAVRTTRAINQGFRTTKGSRGVGNRFEEQRLTLRIHRGRGSVMQHHGSPHSNCSNSTTTTTAGSAAASPASSRSHRQAAHERIKISVSYASNEHLPSATSNCNSQVATPTSPNPAGQPLYTVHYTTSNGKETTQTGLYRDHHLRVNHNHRSRNTRRSSSCDSSTIERDLSPSPESGGNKPKIISRRMGKRNIKAQVKRFRMETKAAKTLGIIVGGFIFCWLPFFTMYLVRAFCVDCIHPLVFSILFWLGYCNSAINPLIYALFSKDFRFAFKRIICRCLCNRRTRTAGSSRRGSDGSQMVGRQFRSPSYNTQQVTNSLGEDSDPGGDPSDSR